MIARLVHAAAGAAVFAAAVAAGVRHERYRSNGTRYWRARAELYLALYDGPRLLTDQFAERAPMRGRHRTTNPLMK